LDLAAADAGGANANALGASVDQRAHSLQIDVPAALGHVMRVADAVAELRSASTHFTYFRHNRLLLGNLQFIKSGAAPQAERQGVIIEEQMSDTQLLTIVLAVVPTMVTVLVGILINNARLSDLRTHLDVRFTNIDQRFSDIDRRFDEMRDLWRSELHRVEEVIDARLKHLEERD
jgi:hypothetical protein